MSSSAKRKRGVAVCEFGACTRQPSFNTGGESKARFCSTHKEVGMVDVKSKLCEFVGCRLRPAFNIEGESRGRFCSAHKEVGMVNVVNKQCEFEDCSKRPNFNSEGESVSRFCSAHKDPGMVDVRSTSCESTRCRVRNPSFNTEGERRGRFCSTHKEPGMMDVKSKHCESPGCRVVNPSFNTEGERTGRFCCKHKETEMVDVKKRRRCDSADCNKQSVFNFEGESTGRFCSTHKEPGMVDVRSKLCEITNCNLRPIFNTEGESRGRFCSAHKEAGMVDVKTKRCASPDCNTRPTYGVPGYAATLCGRHKKTRPGVIKDPKRACSHSECAEQAFFGRVGKSPVHCESHHDPATEVNLVERACLGCGLVMYLDPVSSTCMYCSPALFTRVALMKQMRVQRLFDRNDLLYVSTDRQVDGGACGRERPDFLFDAGTHFVVVEVDEHQHSGRACECEQTRMVNISQGLGLRTVFLRYNPDKYAPAIGVPDTAPEHVRHDWLVRVLTALLSDCDAYASQRQTNSYLQVLYLFFDGHDTSSSPITTCIS